MESSIEVIEVLKAMDLAKRAMKPLKKTKASADGSYKYATLDDVLELLKKTLPRYKLGFVQTLEQTAEGSCLSTTVFHEESGQHFSTLVRIPDLKDDILSEMQSFGSNITYMRRYALCTIFGIVSEDDVDGNSSASGYSQKDRELIMGKCTECHLSAENRKKVKGMINSNIATSVILKSIEAMK